MFNPASSTTLQNVTLGVAYSSRGTYSVTFSLYETGPSLLTLLSSPAATATFSPTWTTTDSRFKTFSLGSAFAVTGGKTYALLVSTTSSGWSWSCCSSDTLPSGLVPGDFTNVGYVDYTFNLLGVLAR